MLKYHQIISVVLPNYIVVLQINIVVSWIHDDDSRIHPDILNNFPSFYSVIPFLNGRNCGYDTNHQRTIIQIHPNNNEDYKNTIGDKYKKTPHLFPQFSLPLHIQNYTL